MRIAVVAVLMLAVLGATASSTYAYTLDPKVEAEFDKVVEFNYRGSAQTSQPSCGAVCQELRSAETRPGGWSTPAGEQLSREARTLRIATGLSDAIRLANSFSLGLAAFDVGYLIGSGVNAKFLRVGLPAKSPNVSAAPQQLIFAASCSPTSPCSIGSAYHDQTTITQPAYIWHWDAAWDSPFGANWWSWRSNDGDCQHPSPPPDAPNSFETVASSSTCFGDPDQTGTTTSAWWYQDDLRATTPVQDYAGEPWDHVDWWPPADPGVPTTTTRTRTELESNRYPLLNEKIEYEVGVPDACDPVDSNVCNPPETDRAQERKCDLSSPENGDPDPLVSTDQYAAAQYSTVTSFTRTPLGGGSPINTALKVGWTGPSVKKEWDGWGWRHVAAKHGWGPADAIATQAALLNAPTLINGRLQYVGPEYSQNGVVCQRRVVVAASALSGEPSSKEIMTSYGEYLRPMP
jgi:hypothetical protein